MNIGNVHIDGPAALGPMAGVTDAAFRHICRELGAALTCTEMVSSRGLVYRDEKTRELLFCPEEDRPVAAQIFGSDPDIMAEQAAALEELPFVKEAEVSHESGTAVVILTGEFDEEAAKNAIEAKDYKYLGAE